MLINDIIKQINKLLSNSSSFLLTYERLRQYIDVAVDHINFELKTNMKTPHEEWEEKEWVYTISYYPKFLGSFYTGINLTANMDHKGKIYCNLSYNTYYYYNGIQWCPINTTKGTYASNDIIEHENFLGIFDTEPEVENPTYPMYYYNSSLGNYYIKNSDSTEWLVVLYPCLKEVKLEIPQISIEEANMYYGTMPDNVIRSVLIYYAAASYLEEEDEFEAQHSAYKQKAEENLQKIKQTNYSMYTCNW